MKFSYNWLKELAGFTDSPQELAEFLTLRVFEVEGLEKSGDDWTLDIKLLPNRIADASGHRGMAREIAALKKLRIRNYELGIREDKKQKTSDLVKINIENAEDCPRYTARMMTGVKVGPSPAWIRERLAACGLQSINNLVDAANYVMLETGQPLHIFDFDKIKNMEATRDKQQETKTIYVRRAKNGEKIMGLDDKGYELNPEILVIADEKKPLAIAGIKGGKESGVSDSTDTIILESANFNPVRIRAASQALGLRTDASYRFEHGMDPNQTTAAVNRMAELIQEIAGGNIYQGIANLYPQKTKPVKILFRPEYAERLIGVKIPASFYPSAFRRLGWKTLKKSIGFIVEPPSIRRDIEIEEDIIEEIARLYDYAHVPAIMPRAAVAAPERNDEVFWEERTRDILASAGFSESTPYEFTGDKELGAFGIKKENLVELQNPPGPDARYLVPRALIKYILSAAENLRNFDAVRIFGIGKSFTEQEGVAERKDLILTLAQKATQGEEEFYLLKGAMDQLLESLGISEHWYDDALDTKYPIHDTDIFHPHRAAEIKIGDEKIGMIGEIHPAILENIKSRARITAAEIDMEKLAALATSEAEYEPVGKYPAIIRDIAVLAPAGAKTQEIENVIHAAGGALLADTDLFDYFQDSAMRKNEQKSLAFHLIFQSPDRTLTDGEIDASMKKITAALEEKEWEVRK